MSRKKTPGTGEFVSVRKIMNEDELVAFNPILAKAVREAENENSQSNAYWGRAVNSLREIVAACVRAGLAPEKIYAMIKTGRILTEDNMKLLTKADIDEWQDAAREYNQLANPKTERANN